MTQHVDTQTVERIATILTGIAGVKGVEVTRVWASPTNSLPRIQVHLPSWRSIPKGGNRPGQRILQRLQPVVVRIIHGRPGATGAVTEAEMRATLLEVERRIAADPHLRVGGAPYASDAICLSGQTGTSGQGASALVATEAVVTVTVHHREGNPTTTLPQAVVHVA